MTAVAAPGAALQQQTDARIIEKEGGFAYVPPKGWRAEETNILKFKILNGPVDSSGVRPNVNFIIVESADPLEKFKASYLEELKAGLFNISIIEERALTTTQGKNVVKLVANSAIQGRQLRQVVYLIDFGLRKLIVTYTRLRNSQQQNDALIDAMVKTVESLDDSTSASSDARHVEAEGGFSYVLPTGWQLRDTDTSPFKVPAAPADSSGIRPNVRFSVYEFESDVDLGAFKEFILQELSALPSFVVQSEEKLTTAEGNAVIKLIANSTQQGRQLRQIVYLVELGPRKKLTATYTRLRTSQQQRDGEVESLIATIRALDSEPSSKSGRHVEPEGGFSYVPPEGWQLRDEPGADFKILATRREGDVAESVVVFFTGDVPSLDANFRREYRANLPNRLREFRGDLRNVRVVRDEGFTTEQGYPAAKFVLDATYSGVRAQLVLYLVDIGSTTVIALYMRPRASSAENDQAIETMINTLGPAEAAKDAGTQRYYERRGNFSYVLPEGWTLKQPDELPASANAKFAAVFGPASENDTSPSVLFFEDTLSGTFAEYLDAAVQSLRDGGARNISKPERMKTNDGLEFARIVATRTDSGKRFQQTYYIFPERNRVIFALYTRLAQGQQSRFDKSIEAMMQSFRFGR